MMRKIGFFVFQFCLISIFMGSAAWADTVFSFNGVGDPTRRMDVRARAMGGAGRALADGENFSSSNPALIAAFAQPGVTSLYFIQRRSLKDNLGNQHVVTDGDIGSFQLALPLKRGTVLGIGLEPLTEVDFIVVEPGGSGPLAHTLRIDGTGGIQAVTLSLGQQMGRLYLGGRMDMVFMGTISEVWRKDYDSEIVTDLDGANLPRLLDTEDKYIRTHRGLLGAVGGVYRPTANWFLGLAFQAGGKLTQTRTLRNFFANLGFEPDLKLKADVELP
ncbi:MAG: hypothetical protein O2954_21035, partial [bacterium]|nr:hypothetical protein [bacterium]